MKMNNWYEIKEQSAGKYRLLFLWYVYKIFKLSGLKFMLRLILPFIIVFSKSARVNSKKYRMILNNFQKSHNLKVAKFSSYSHISSYALSLAEKFSVLCDDKTSLKFDVNKNENWVEFLDVLNKKIGAFLICSHLGNVEVLSALPEVNKDYPKSYLHAFMETSHNNVFHKFITERMKDKSFELHSTETLNFDTIMKLYEDLQAGQLLMMAGDRVSAENPKMVVECEMLDRKIKLPKGVFKFAQTLHYPTFAVFLMREKKSYKLYLYKIDNNLSVSEMAKQYASVLEKLLLLYPNQWYNFYPYFE